MQWLPEEERQNIVRLSKSRSLSLRSQLQTLLPAMTTIREALQSNVRHNHLESDSTGEATRIIMTDKRVNQFIFNYQSNVYMSRKNR